jgi:cytochrome c peroxidase
MSSRLTAALRFSFLSAILAASSPVFAKEDLSNWKLPPVPIPTDNPQSEAKAGLGKQLAFDVRLSKNDSLSCSNCHLPSAGGAAPTPRAFGHGGELGRWAPSWDNSGYYTSLFWDGRAASLEEQTGLLPGHMGPVTSPAEMGSKVEDVVAKLNAVPAYKKQFNSVFGSDATPETIAKAIAAFERTLVARKSPFQRYVSGDSRAINAAAKRGFDIFRTKALCATCHTPPLLTDNAFHDISIPQVGPLQEDDGRFAVSKDAADKGKFKTPSLYNSASFSFQMHDGAFSTLSQVTDHYNKGGNPQNKHQDPLIMPLKLTDKEKADLIAFLETLTDKSLDQISRPELP